MSRQHRSSWVYDSPPCRQSDGRLPDRPRTQSICFNLWDDLRAPCETTSRRDRVDKTLTIRAQKRYLDEWFGLDKEAHIKSLEYSYARGSTRPEPNGFKVACIGAGVASLTCAHDLLRLGYQVDVYEQMPLPGGMLVYGVPTYRLKNDIPVNECAAIEHLGAKIHYNTKVGRDITLTQ